MRNILLLAIGTAFGCTRSGDKPTVRSNEIATEPTFTVPPWPLSTKSAEARAHIATAERFGFTGDHARAYDEYKRAVAADTSSAFGYLMVWMEEGNNNQERSDYLERARARIATANRTESTLIEMARKEFSENDFQGSLVLAKSLRDMDSTNARAWLLVGRGELNLRHYPEARAAFREALAIDSTFPPALLSLGASYLNGAGADTSESEKYIEQGVKLWPNAYDAYNFLGRLRRAQNRTDEALAAYSKMIALHPREAIGYTLRGNLNALLSHYDDARRDYKAAMNVRTGSDKIKNAIWLTYVSAYEGKFRLALQELEDLELAAEGMPSRSPLEDREQIRNVQTKIAIYHGQFDVAAKALERRKASIENAAQTATSAAVRRTTLSDIVYCEAILAAFRNDFVTANRKANELAQLHATDGSPLVAGNVHEVRGQIALLQKRYAAAETELRQTELGAIASYNLALALEGVKKNAEARTLLKNIVEQRQFLTLASVIVRYDAAQKLLALGDADSTTKTRVGR